MPRLDREDGQVIVEWGLIIGGISLVLVVSIIVTPLGGAFTTLVESLRDAFAS